MRHSDFSLNTFVTHFLLRPTLLPMPAAHQGRQAAVLVPIICHAEPTLLLTRRADHLRKHAGQVAFPGGAADDSDASLIITALREAQEEVAIPPHTVQILGTLTPVGSTTGFQVTPVVGLLPTSTRFLPNADEVAEVFEIPLREALRLSRYTPLDIRRHGQAHRVYLSWYQQQFVWGMTAAVIRQLALHVAASE